MSGFEKPFKYNGGKYKKRTLRSQYGSPGVYIIRKDQVITYIGMSKTNALEALYRHFYPWGQDARKGYQKRVVYLDHKDENYLVQIIDTTMSDAKLMEKGLVVALKPRDNSDLFPEFIEKLHKGLNQNTEDNLPF